MGGVDYMEKWKMYDDVIEVSNTGRVRALDTGYEYKLHNNGNGYYSVSIIRTEHGEVIYKKREYVHRLVAQAFLGDIPKGSHVNHIDFNRSNNNVCNLEIVTPLENLRHSREAGRMSTREANLATMEPIYVLEKETGAIKYFGSTKEASLYYGYNEHRFSHILVRHNGENTRFKVWREKEQYNNGK